MKKHILFLAFVLVGQWANAQMQSWTWGINKVMFSIPTSFNIDQNDIELFSAGDSSIYLSIYPANVENLNKYDLINALEEWATNESLRFDAENLTFIEDLNGFEGYMLDCIDPKGYPTTIGILIHPNYPNLGLGIWLQYQEGQLQKAIEILQSFTPIN